MCPLVSLGEKIRPLSQQSGVCSDENSLKSSPGELLPNHMFDLSPKHCSFDSSTYIPSQTISAIAQPVTAIATSVVPMKVHALRSPRRLTLFTERGILGDLFILPMANVIQAKHAQVTHLKTPIMYLATQLIFNHEVIRICSSCVVSCKCS